MRAERSIQPIQRASARECQFSSGRSGRKNLDDFLPKHAPGL